MSRGPCPHKIAIQKFHHVAEFSCLPESDGQARASWHYIATGSHENPEWYRQHDQPDNVPNVDEYVEAHRHQVDLPNVTSSGEVTESAVGEQAMETDEQEHEDREPFKTKFSADLDLLKQNLFADIEDDENNFKGFKKFAKFIGSLARDNSQTRLRKIYNIINTTKKKIGNRIPVQSTSLSRRKNKNRGKGVSTYGRRVKDTTLNVTESDSVYVPAPSRRQRSNRLAHDLQQAVLENRPNAKKH